MRRTEVILTVYSATLGREGAVSEAIERVRMGDPGVHLSRLDADDVDDMVTGSSLVWGSSLWVGCFNFLDERAPDWSSELAGALHHVSVDRAVMLVDGPDWLTVFVLMRLDVAPATSVWIPMVRQ